jgi:hypothetical protein
MGRTSKGIRYLLAGTLSVAACGGDTELVRPLPRTSAEFSVRVLPDPDDLSVAQRLGWADGIPDADVVLTPVDSSSPPDTAHTDADGVAEFGSVPSGDYIVEAHRWLTPAELAQVSPDSANGWVLGARITAPGIGTASVLAVASRRRSLVISEWSFNIPYISGLGQYDYGGFLELYNNADTTLFLDGMVIAEIAYGTQGESCALFAQFNNDPAGIWTSFFQRLPGTGSDYPLAPGQVALIATDAIDHRAVFPGTLDLQLADFEFIGQKDADNPAVPNAVDIGFEPHSNGHGLFFPFDAVAIARPFEVGDMVRGAQPNGRPAGRIAAADLLDVLTLQFNYLPALPRLCSNFVHPRFDREYSRARGYDALEEEQHSLVRRSTGLTSAGHVVLQYTRSSNLDFIRSLRTPGRYP